MKAVLIDVMNLANRAAHTTGQLALPDGTPTGVIFGILRDCLELERTFQTWNFVFCFDSYKSLRSQIAPEYKQKRKASREAESEEKKQLRKDMHAQVAELPGLLRDAGCLNLCRQAGYEADDIIASVVRSNPNYEIVMCTTDSDCFQLLEEGRVTQWLPTTKTEMTESVFFQKHGVAPSQWASVKAWAGCPSDNIVGLKGIGEKRACQFIQGKFKEPATFTDHVDVYNRNVVLTRLPFKGCKPAVIRNQETRIEWSVLRKYIDPEFVEITGV